MMVVSQISLKAGWDTVWGAVSGAWGSGLSNLLTAIGVVMVLAAVSKWAWDRRRGGGGGGGSSAVVWAMVIGGLLAAPQVIFPAVLTVVDWVLNTGAAFLPK